MHVKDALFNSVAQLFDSQPVFASVLDREIVFLPLYKDYVSNNDARGLDDATVLMRLPDYVQSYQTSKFRKSHQRRLHLLNSQVHPKKGMKILDVGCQFGTNLLELAEHGAECYGVDIVSAVASAFNLRIHSLKAKAYVIVADGAHLPFRSDLFDVVMSREALSHVVNIDATLDEMARVSKEKIIVEDSNLFSVVFFSLIFNRNFGLKWLFLKGKVYDGLYNGVQKNENIHSSFYWKKKLGKYGFARLVCTLPFNTETFRGKVLNALYKYFGIGVLVTSIKMDGWRNA